jgi:hypothetical protein
MTMNTSEDPAVDVPAELIGPETPVDGNERPSVITRVVPAEEVEYQLRWGSALLEQRPQIQLQVCGQTLNLVLKDMIIAGRYNAATEERPDLDLEPFDALNKGVSRQHAAFVYEDHIIKIMDMDSPNGTYLNGFRLTPYQSRVLRDGDEVRLGRLVMNVKFMTPLEI